MRIINKQQRMREMTKSLRAPFEETLMGKHTATQLTLECNYAFELQ
jgi:hypothetical protein